MAHALRRRGEMVKHLRLLGVVIACLAGCSKASSDNCKDSYQAKRVEETSKAADKRIMGAMTIGIEDMKRRMIAAGKPLDEAIAEGTLPAAKDIPTSPRLPDGSLHPLVKKFAINGDGKLRGDGPSMDVLQQEMRQAIDALEAAKKNGCPKS